MTTQQPLSEIADIVRGISFPKEAKSLEPRSGDVACLRTTNVQREVEWDDLWFVPSEHVKRAEQFVQPGDVLISTANSYELVGKVALVSAVPRQATLGAFISLIRARSGVDPRFLYHQLAWGRTQSRIRETASTTTNISNVSTKKLAALELDVPPLDDQCRIVAELEKQFSRLDKAVANLKRVKANLKRCEEATISDASMAARRGSPICLASKLFSWSSGVNLPASKQHGGPVPVYGGNGITGYHSQGNIRQATVVIGRVGAGCGNVHLVREPAWITDNAIYASRVADEIALPYAALMFGAANLNSGAAGSGQPFVNQRMLNEVHVPLPSLDEQRRIVAEVDRRLSIVREVEAEVDANLKRAQALRQAVLQRAFSGDAAGS